MNKRLDLSLILACYNEGPTLRQSLKKIEDALSDIRLSYEIICIDDKSKDRTADIIAIFTKGRKNWRTYFHKINKGRGATVKDGIFKSRGKVVGYVDVDLEVSAIYISTFIRTLKKGYDAAIATRIYKITPRNLVRVASTILYLKLSQLVFGHKFADTEAGYKFFNRRKVLPVLKKTKSRSWFFDTEIVLRTSKHNLKIKEIPVLFLKRRKKISTVRLLPDTIDYLKSLWRFRRELSL